MPPDSRLAPAPRRPARRGLAALAAAALCALVAGCSEEAARLLVDVDLSACSAASCAEHAELFVLRGASASSACLIGRYDVDPRGSKRSFPDAPIDVPGQTSWAVVVYCGDRCARCIGVAEGVNSGSQNRVTLQPTPLGNTCFERGTLFGVSPRSCAAPPIDAGPPDAPPPDSAPPDSAPSDVGLVDASPTDSTSRRDAGTSTCRDVLECGRRCSSASCVDQCVTAGCQTAQASALALIVCARSRCAAVCSGGITLLCGVCLTALCPIDFVQCSNNRC